MYFVRTSAMSSKRSKIVHYVWGGGDPSSSSFGTMGCQYNKHEWILRKCTIAVGIGWYCLTCRAPLLPQYHEPPVKTAMFSKFLGPTLKDIAISL
jgi:hypothetical protein